MSLVYAHKVETEFCSPVTSSIAFLIPSANTLCVAIKSFFFIFYTPRY